MIKHADIGVIGLGVMGENLMLNMEQNGFTVACYNRTAEKVDEFISGRGKGLDFVACHSLAQLADCLKKPRRVLLMVKAGKPVDDIMTTLMPLMEPGDILIDGGNSQFQDTMRRCRETAERGIHFVGAGISGGEDGARHGPSIMPSGADAAWPAIREIFQTIAAKVEGGIPCCEWVGPDGSGHFVKMVHNGIEYGDMQLICEAYHIMSQGLGMTAPEMSQVFHNWNQRELDSYLIEITSDILAKTDQETGQPTVDIILDVAGQKGTGKWTSQVGLDLGAAIPQIAEAVFARSLSAVKDERVAAASLLKGPANKFNGNRNSLLNHLEKALYAAKICSYAQGFQLLRAAAHEYKWPLNYGQIAMLWRGGCIIRARFLDLINDAFLKDPELANLLLAPDFSAVLADAQTSWREVIKTAIDCGIPVPAMSSALCYYDGYRCERLPANLLQAQRDYFGAHTYERTDRPRGQFFHASWAEK